MRKVSKSRVDDDIISSTNGSVNDDGQADEDAGDVDYKDDNDRDDNEDANGGGRGSENDDDDDDAPLDSSTSKAKTPKKSKKSKTPKSKTAKSKKTAKKSKNDDTKEDASEDDEEEEYEVEKVVGSKKLKGKIHYLIRWKGYSASSDTWEPEDTLSCPELIKKYKEEGIDEEESTPAKRGRKRKPGKAKKEKPSKPAKRPKTDWDGENADENAEYEVERILEVHHKKSGAREFLIHWKGWSSKFDSWEPEEHLNCTEMIEKFMSKVEKAKSSDSRSLRVNPGSTNRYTLQAPSTGRRLSKRHGQSQRVRYDDAE